MQTEILPTYQSGDIIQGRYRVIRLIGKGGFGEVFEAMDEQLSRPVAVKVLLNPDQNTTTGQERARRFVNEAKITAQIKHPAIPITFDMGKLENGALFLVTELLRGESLSDLLKRQTLSLLEALRCLSDIASCLATAHQVGVLHRDIKPSNIFLDYDGNKISYKLLDFGIAKIYSESQMEGIDEERTQDGLFIGSPHYMAPERFAKKREYDQRSDIYSLGIVFYRCLTGKCPYMGENLVDIAMAHIREPIPQLPLEKEYSHYQNILQSFLDSMLIKDPLNRISDAQLLHFQAQSLLGLIFQNKEPPKSLTEISVSHYTPSPTSISDMRVVGNFNGFTGSSKLPSYTPNSVSPPSTPIPVEIKEISQVTPQPFQAEIAYETESNPIIQNPPKANLWLYLLMIPVVVIAFIVVKKTQQPDNTLSLDTLANTQTQTVTPKLELNEVNQNSTSSDQNSQQLPDLKPINAIEEQNNITLVPIENPDKKIKKTVKVEPTISVDKKNQKKISIDELIKNDQKDKEVQVKADENLPSAIKLEIKPIKTSYFVGEKIRVIGLDQNGQQIKPNLLSPRLSVSVGIFQNQDLILKNKSEHIAELKLCLKANPKICSDAYPVMVDEVQ
jgi:serine/threonine protein kinase